MAEKTEKATPKKLRDARKKGQVAKSQDLPAAFTFATSLAMTLFFIDSIYGNVSGFLTSAFNSVRREDVLSLIPYMFYQGGLLIFTCSIPIMLCVVFVGVTINFLSIGPCFAVEALKPDIKRLNPVDNLKAKFKMKTLVELLKSLFKVFVAAYIIYGVVRESIPTLIATVSLPLDAALMVFQTFLLQVIVRVGLFFLAVAILDFAYQRYNFAKEMKMEKFEVKQEFKNTEGDPQIKGKRKELAREIAYQDGPALGVQRSKAVITNPTHLAIAIGYERDVDPAPYILAMGSDKMATQIIKLAEKYEVPVLRNVSLARTLWTEGELFDFIPEETYEAIAKILQWIANVESEGENPSLEYTP